MKKTETNQEIAPVLTKPSKEEIKQNLAILETFESKDGVYKVHVKDVLRDDQGRLHSFNAPAFTMKDGWGVFAIHGVILGSTDVYDRYTGKPEMIEDQSNLRDRTFLIRKLKYGVEHHLSKQDIDTEENAEIRRVMLEMYGFGRFLQESNAKILDEDTVEYLMDDGTKQKHKRQLVQLELKPTADGIQEEPIVGILVTNSTANGMYSKVSYELKPIESYSEFEQRRIKRKYENTEFLVYEGDKLFVKTVIEGGEFIPELDADGNLQFKTYFIPCHPELRPQDLDDETGNVLWTGEPQKMTIQNAIASTFGLYGDEYAPEVET